MRYPWSHFSTGSPRSEFARCNICGEDLAFWSPKSGASVPPAARKKIDAHPCIVAFWDDHTGPTEAQRDERVRIDMAPDEALRRILAPKNASNQSAGSLGA
jgi:hypothetical protein